MKISKMDRRVMRAVASVEGCTYGQLVDLVVDDRMVFTSALNTAVRVRGSVRHLLQHNVVTISPEPVDRRIPADAAVELSDVGWELINSGEV